MKKKTNIRTMIRQIVREEVAMAIHEVITELKQPSLSSQQVSQPKPKKKIVEKKTFSKNSILNDVINETAQAEEWKQMGGGTYDSGKMNEVLSSQYGDLMNDSTEVNSDAMVASMGVNPDKAPDVVKNMFTKDYSKLLKKVDEKSKQKRGM
jgi:hypothetical protein